MTRAEQRLADLEAQVAELTVTLKKVAREAVALRILDETSPERYASGYPVPPRHLRVVREGAS